MDHADMSKRDRHSSFSVGGRSNQNTGNDAPQFSRHIMSSVPSQLSQSASFAGGVGQDGRFPPGPNGYSAPNGRPRNGSQPDNQGAGAGATDFGPSETARYPKSQSMAFGANSRSDPMGDRDGQSRDWQQGGAPSKQGLEQGQGQVGMPKSQSMPFSQYADRDRGANPQDQRRMSQGMGEERGFGGLPDPVAPAPIDKTPKPSPRIVTSGPTPPALAVGAGANGDQGGQAVGKTQNFDDIVELISAQPQKTYVASPPELEMILARTSAGGQPK